MLDERPAAERARTRCACSTKNPNACGRCCAGRTDDRRLALRRVPRALRRGAALPRRLRRPVQAGPTLVRGLDYYTRTTWEFVGPDESAQASTSAAAAATTGSPRRSAGRRRRGSASAPASSGWCSRSSRGRSTARAAGARRVLRLRAGVDRAPWRVLKSFARRARVDMDYAGRSVKGQHTQAGRCARRRRSSSGRLDTRRRRRARRARDGSRAGGARDVA